MRNGFPRLLVPFSVSVLSVEVENSCYWPLGAILKAEAPKAIWDEDHPYDSKSIVCPHKVYECLD